MPHGGRKGDNDERALWSRTDRHDREGRRARQLHEALVGKTIAKVYLGDDEPIEEPGEARFESEYLVFEFTDGSMTKLSIGASNSFFPGTDADARTILEKASSGSH